MQEWTIFNRNDPQYLVDITISEASDRAIREIAIKHGWNLGDMVLVKDRNRPWIIPLFTQPQNEVNK